MPVYSKIFVSMYDGSLATQGPWQALVAFQQMLILANRHGVVDMTPEAMSRRTTVPLEIFEAGIPVLEAPDTSSRSGIEEGRRIKRLHPDREWGWQIVNFEAYNAIRTEEDRRDYMRNYMRKRREAEDVNSVNKVNAVSPSYSDNTHTQKRTKIAPDGAKKASIEEEPRPRDALWDALLQACGVPLTAPIPKSARGAYNRALKDLRDIGADPGQIDAHAQQFRLRWPNVTLTPTALVRRWNECVSQNRSLNNAVR